MHFRKLALLLAAALAVPMGLVLTGSASAGMRRCFDGDHTQRGIMRRDVDGDGDRDGAWIIARRRDGRCRYFLKVNMQQDEDTKRLRGADRFTMRHFSRVSGMIEVDLVPGKEIAVLMAQGANTSFSGLFTIRNGEIRMIRVDGRGAPPGDLFPYGGSITFQAGEDCARNRPPGTIIFSTAELNDAGNRYKVRRNWFMTEGVSRHFERLGPTDRERVRPQNLDRFYEFNSPPFQRCAGRFRG
jgi:hypothetical protein